MIVVDSSVWIANLRNQPIWQVQKLNEIKATDIVVGDIVLEEVLSGVESEQAALRLQRQFTAYGIVPMLNPALAVVGAAYYRSLRRRGISIRKLADVIIATFCIEEGHQLLHGDRHFDHFEQHLGLRVLR